ncbi:hypothetical protein Tco_1100246, partial [Tanacetum coccineum]
MSVHPSDNGTILNRIPGMCLMENSMCLLEVLLATGLRATRCSREVEVLGQVVPLDNDKGWSWYGRQETPFIRKHK